MNRWGYAGLVVLAGCAWSNSMYEARRTTRDAERAERDRRPGEASQLWGIAVTKAESAYARSPRGAHGAEALWLAGNAEAHNSNCGRAAPFLERSLFGGPNAPWTEQLLLELAHCQEAIQGPTAASIYAMLAARTRNPEVKRAAQLREGHVLVSQGHWAEGAAALAGDDTMPARIDRALALAHLGRTGEALADMEPLLAASDTLVRWVDYVDAFAATNSDDTDKLLVRLLAFTDVSDEQRSQWLLAGAQSALRIDPAAADRRLQALAARPRGRAVAEAGVVQLQRRMLDAASVPVLRALLDSLARGGPPPEGSLAAGQLVRMERQGALLVRGNDSTRAGAPAGDLRIFALAEYARDSLASARLAGWLFARVERDWPESPYGPKALLAQAAVEPDSASALLIRVRGHADNPYVLSAQGDRGAQARMTQLEDSLGRYMRTLRLEPATAARAVQEQE